MIDLLQLNNLSVGYTNGKNKTIVVADISLSLPRGCVVSLLGANGAGKSTLLRTIAGAQPAISGEVKIAGELIGKLSRHEMARLISVVTTDRTNAGGLTVEELVALGRQPYTGFLGRLDANDRKMVRDAIESVGITHKLHSFVAELSDGERQKAMIAKALAQNAPIILLDEPTSFLDVASRVDVLQLLHHLARCENKAILLSSHDVALSLAMSDRLWMLVGNSKLIDGQTEDIVLQGKLNHLFSTDNVKFDALSGEFVAKTDHNKKAYNIKGCDATRCRWIANALRRNGFVVSDDAKDTIDADKIDSVEILLSQIL